MITGCCDTQLVMTSVNCELSDFEGLFNTQHQLSIELIHFCEHDRSSFTSLANSHDFTRSTANSNIKTYRLA
ncbi:hypothetical protein [Photorhabdus namnaonensis]|uniref:hypothetical protein n=1 Tax=Photorhabdus namnaonensis TaxID=1851568 RepID=UPI0010426B58|nr:hypothetical protein [Photorhabdus namnaonensis]